MKHAALAAFALAMIVLLTWDLGASRFLGDELNALHFMRPSLPDYLADFHYGHAIKLQFWTIHQLAQGDLIWYRLPAVISAAATIWFVAAWGFGRYPMVGGIGSRVAAGALLGANAHFLYFSRWGMPVYAEGMLITAWLLSASLTWCYRGELPRWRAWHLFAMALLPFLYPATIVLLGALAVAWQCLVFARAGYCWKWTLPPGSLSSWLPLIAGLVGLIITLFITPEAHWARGRGHHSGFSDYDGTVAAYMLDALKRLGLDLSTVAGATQFAGHAYMVFATIAALSILVAPLVARLNGNEPRSTGVLRCFALLYLVAFSSIGVSLGAGLLDAFPAGRVRYLFFLLPLAAFATLLSLGYLGDLFRRYFGQRLTLALIPLPFLLTGIVTLAVLNERSATRKLEHAQFDALVSAETRILVSIAPGYFFPDSLRPGGSTHLRASSLAWLPGDSLLEAVRQTAGQVGQVGLYGMTRNLLTADGLLSSEVTRFLDHTGLRLAARLDASPRSLLLFDLPSATPPRPWRAVSSKVPLPNEHIRAVRLQMAAGRAAQVKIKELVLITGYTRSTIDVCADGRLELVRGQRLNRVSNAGCELSLGTENGPGWFAPSALKGLPPSRNRWLELEVDGELDSEIRVYLDLGRGYNSREMLLIPTSAPTSSADEHIPSVGNPNRAALHYTAGRISDPPLSNKPHLTYLPDQL